MADHARGGSVPVGGSSGADSSPGPGTLTVADRVLERIAARAALDIPGVVRHRGGVGSVLGSVGERSALPNATVHAGGARITLSLALEWPCAVAEVSRRTRDHVAAEVERLAGVAPLRVDVTVTKFEPRQAIRRLQRGYVDLPPVRDDSDAGTPRPVIPKTDHPPTDALDPAHPLDDEPTTTTPTITIDTGVRR